MYKRQLFHPPGRIEAVGSAEDEVALLDGLAAGVVGDVGHVVGSVLAARTAGEHAHAIAGRTDDSNSGDKIRDWLIPTPPRFRRVLEKFARLNSINTCYVSLTCVSLSSCFLAPKEAIIYFHVNFGLVICISMTL